MSASPSTPNNQAKAPKKGVEAYQKPVPMNTPDTKFYTKSSLYQEFLAEREEILRYKWLESERLGYDIGFEKALLDWIRKHREKWRASRRHQRMQKRSAKG